METIGKIAIGITVAGVVGAAAYYLLIANKPTDTPIARVAAKPIGFSLSDLRAKQWKNQVGTVIPQNYIEAYNPATGVVTHVDHAWIGLLLDSNTISWTKNTGEQGWWTCFNNC
jgi:hypothetical protein